MKAKNLSGSAPGGERQRLAKLLPLDIPLVIQIFPIYSCIFECNYCIFSIDKSKRGFISDKINLDINLYKRCIDDISKFKEKIKVLRFVGIGEPLLYKNIVEMVEYASDKKIAKTIEILTNGYLLNNQMSDNLIRAGLNRLVISIQGTSKEKYKEISKINIDFDKFVNNIRYFYNKKNEINPNIRDIQVYIKIVDTALDRSNNQAKQLSDKSDKLRIDNCNKDDENKFYNIFGDICDSIGIEYTVPIHSGMNYDKLFKYKENKKLTQFGLPIDKDKEIKVCPQPFFTMQINPDGKVVPCFSWEYPEIMGDCNNESIYDIWNGKKYQNFRYLMLEKSKNHFETCKNCNMIKYRLFPEDMLDNDIEKLKEFYIN